MVDPEVLCPSGFGLDLRTLLGGQQGPQAPSAVGAGPRADLTTRQSHPLPHLGVYGFGARMVHHPGPGSPQSVEKTAQDGGRLSIRG